MHSGYPGGVGHLMFPWSNERSRLRTLSEQMYAPVRLRLDGVDVFSTLIAPCVRPAPAVVAHFKTMHAFTAPEPCGPLVRWYRQKGYPHTAKIADAVIINSESLRREVDRYLDVDPAKLHLIPEAVDHDLFRPGDPDEARDHLAQRYGVRARSCCSSRRCGRTRTATVCCGRSHGEPSSVTTASSSSGRAATSRTSRSSGRWPTARHRGARRLGRWRAAGGDRPLLPCRLGVRLPVTQRDLRPARSSRRWRPAAPS